MANWWKIKGGASMPPGQWKRASPLLTAYGISHRKADALTFAKTAIKMHGKGKPFGLLIEREPDNPQDPNALKIIGWGNGLSRHVGYVEAVEAARARERFPNVPLAAELYSLYLGGGGFIDIRYFLMTPEGVSPVASGRVRSLLERTRDELLVLSFAARADNRLGRLESQILNTYASERARDYGIPLLVGTNGNTVKRHVVSRLHGRPTGGRAGLPAAECSR